MCVRVQEYTDKADVWSLGCLLYYMLELAPPFDGSNPLAVASNIVEGTYPALSCESHYTAQLTGLVARLLTTEPAQRPNIVQVRARAATARVTPSPNRFVPQLDKAAVRSQRTVPHGWTQVKLKQPVWWEHAQLAHLQSAHTHRLVRLSLWVCPSASHLWLTLPHPTG